MELIHPLTSTLDLGGIWRTSLALLAILAALLFARKNTAPRIGWSASLLWAYVLAYSIYIIEYPRAHFGAVTTGYQATAGGALIAALFIPWLVVNYSRAITKILPWYVAAETILLMVGKEGLIGPISFTLAFLACSTPFIPIWLTPLIWGLVLIHHGATAQFIICAQLFAVAVSSKKKVFRILAGLGVPLFIGAALYHTRSGVLDSSVRLWKWRQMMGLWRHDLHSVVFGVGPGSFIWSSAEADGFQASFNGLFLQMHNDWLQILFEYGLIGFMLSLTVFVTAVKQSWRRPPILAAVCGAAAFMTTYYPLHYAPSALMMALIFTIALRKGRSRWETTE